MGATTIGYICGPGLQELVSKLSGEAVVLVIQQGSRSARLSPQSMIHYARKVFKCSIRIVQSFTIL